MTLSCQLYAREAKMLKGAPIKGTTITIHNQKLSVADVGLDDDDELMLTKERVSIDQ